MKFIIPPSMADALRLADGTLPANVEIWDGYTRASSGEERTWLGDSADFNVALRRIDPMHTPQLAEHPAPATFKGKRIAQWKQERRGTR